MNEKLIEALAKLGTNATVAFQWYIVADVAETLISATALVIVFLFAMRTIKWAIRYVYGDHTK